MKECYTTKEWVKCQKPNQLLKQEYSYSKWLSSKRLNPNLAEKMKLCRNSRATRQLLLLRLRENVHSRENIWRNISRDWKFYHIGEGMAMIQWRLTGRDLWQWGSLLRWWQNWLGNWLLGLKKPSLKAIHLDASDNCKEVPFWVLAIIIEGHMALSLMHTTGQSLPVGFQGIEVRRNTPTKKRPFFLFWFSSIALYCQLAFCQLAKDKCLQYSVLWSQSKYKKDVFKLRSNDFITSTEVKVLFVFEKKLYFLINYRKWWKNILNCVKILSIMLLLSALNFKELRKCQSRT